MPGDSWIGSLNVQEWCKTQMLREKTGLEKAFKAENVSLVQSESAVQIQLSLYGQANTLLQAFQTSLTALSNAFTPSVTATSSNPNVATVSIPANTTTASPSHTITVSQLAQASSIASSPFSSSSTALNITDSLTITSGGNSFPVNIGPTDTLQTIVTNINNTAGSSGVTASVISAQDGNHLVISSQTGAANQLSISETGTGSNSLNVSTGVGGTGTVMTSGQDALFTFDNLPMQSASNYNITSVPGLTINLTGLSPTTGTPAVATPTYININSTNQPDAVSTAANNMVTAYNQLVTFIEQAQATLTAPPPDPSKASSMSPDSTLATILTSIQNAMSVGTSAYQALGSIGITVQPTSAQTVTVSGTSQQLSYQLTGLLAINSDSSNGLPTLSGKLATSFSTVQSVLTDSTTGIATTLTKMTNAQNGTLYQLLNSSTGMSGTLNTMGAIPKSNALLKTLQQQMTDATNKENTLEAQLIMKYANLELSLTKLQNTSIYISQTVSMMSK